MAGWVSVLEQYGGWRLRGGWDCPWSNTPSHTPRLMTSRPAAAEAQKLAQQFSQSEFISKLLPESGILDALKKVLLRLK